MRGHGRDNLGEVPDLGMALGSVYVQQSKCKCCGCMPWRWQLSAISARQAPCLPECSVSVSASPQIKLRLHPLYRGEERCICLKKGEGRAEEARNPQHKEYTADGEGRSLGCYVPWVKSLILPELQFPCLLENKEAKVMPLKIPSDPWNGFNNSSACGSQTGVEQWARPSLSRARRCCLGRGVPWEQRSPATCASLNFCEPQGTPPWLQGDVQRFQFGVGSKNIHFYDLVIWCREPTAHTLSDTGVIVKDMSFGFRLLDLISSLSLSSCVSWLPCLVSLSRSFFLCTMELAIPTLQHCCKD